MLICAKLRMAMLLLLGLLGGANSTLLVSSINTLLTYLQVNSSLLFTSNDTIAFMNASLSQAFKLNATEVSLIMDLFRISSTDWA